MGVGVITLPMYGGGIIIIPMYGGGIIIPMYGGGITIIPMYGGGVIIIPKYRSRGMWSSQLPNQTGMLVIRKPDQHLCVVFYIL